ncbi:hypothetical protein GUJ93_ZPchr0008g13437 [Zizania palustris]|uniref:Uncharacterized protein n=1 Tax=Zizania palustris TaxID=103762 RepID=A0A8J5UWY7_ZIZPA|nr:hypothetical protein GUJ93_ZPchr0008g13437 [Zizania palustris]
MNSESVSLSKELDELVKKKEIAAIAFDADKATIMREMRELKTKVEVIQADKESDEKTMWDKDAAKLRTELKELHVLMSQLQSSYNDLNANLSRLNDEKNSVQKALDDEKAEGASDLQLTATDGPATIDRPLLSSIVRRTAQISCAAYSSSGSSSNIEDSPLLPMPRNSRLAWFRERRPLYVTNITAAMNDGIGEDEVFSRLFAKKEMHIFMVGLDTIRETTILYKLKFGEIVTTIPTIGSTGDVN